MSTVREGAFDGARDQQIAHRSGSWPGVDVCRERDRCGKTPEGGKSMSSLPQEERRT